MRIIFFLLSLCARAYFLLRLIFTRKKETGCGSVDDKTSRGNFQTNKKKLQILKYIYKKEIRWKQNLHWELEYAGSSYCENIVSHALDPYIGRTPCMLDHSRPDGLNLFSQEEEEKIK